MNVPAASTLGEAKARMKPKPDLVLPKIDAGGDTSVFAQQPSTSDAASASNNATAASPAAATPSQSQQQQQPQQQSDAAAGQHVPPPQPVRWDPADTTRGWEPLEHGRMRVALGRHFRDDPDQSNAASPFTNALPEDLTAEAAAQREEEDAEAPNGDALLNVCSATEPRLELELECSVINAINSAYTSSGYPSVMTAGNARGAVYGSFVDLKGPSVHTLNLPPKETIVIAPGSGSNGATTTTPLSSSTGDGRPQMETLMKVMWHRGSGLLVPAVDHKSASSAEGKKAGGGAGTSQPGPSSPGQNIHPAAAAAMGIARPTTLQQHISQFPDGIHGRHSSPHLRDLLLRGKYPTTAEEAATFPSTQAAAAAAHATGPAGSPTGGILNAPPPGVPPISGAPVQHTLVSANTFNHLTVHFVAHQDGKFLYSAPVQTLSASIATRKVTAQHLFLIGREEVDPVEDLDSYELLFSSSGSSRVASPATPAGSFGTSARRSSLLRESSDTPVGSPGPTTTTTTGTSADCVKGRREKITFRPLAVPDEDKSVFFDAKGVQFGGADLRKRTIQAALVGFLVEPMLLFGNQNGDIFVHSILEEKIVQRLNFNNGLSTLSSTTGGGSGSGSSGIGKLIVSPVSTIVEVQNGLEKKLSSLAQNIALAKANRRNSVVMGEHVRYPAPGEAVDGASNRGYFPLSPSLFAVGFDCGDVLLICVTTEGAWVLKHFSNSFGHRPIQVIAPRVPSFYVRLWACYSTFGAKTSSPRSTGSGSGGGGFTPSSTLVAPTTALFVPDEEQHVAAISCNGGTILLVRLPGLEVLSALSVYDYNAVGEILALSWCASATATLLTPDLLFASGEDDMMTAFQLMSTAMIPRNSSGAFPPAAGANGGSDAQTALSEPSSNVSFHLGSGLRILERKRFHRSWVKHTATLPLVLPARTAGQGMPQFVGAALVATAYDSKTSFWPIVFNRGDRDADDAEYLLIDGPTASQPLHNEMTVSTAVGGGGTSYFLASVCCRGRVRLWSCHVAAE